MRAIVSIRIVALMRRIGASYPLGAVLLLAVSGTQPLPAQDALVAVANSEMQPIYRMIRATGGITSPRAALLSTAAGGLIARFAVDIGDVVATGDKLVELDADLARFELQGVRANLEETRNALQDARRRYQEAERLGGEQGVIAATEIESRRAEVAVLEASLAAAAARVSQYEEIVARHTVRAPFSGVVTERSAEVGEWVNPGDALLRLVATDNLQFDFRLPQADFRGLAAGQPVTLSVDSLPDQEFPGRIVAIVPVSDPGDRTFLLRVVASDVVPVGMMPGMSARMRIAVDQGYTGVVVPRDAILRYPDGRTVVWVVEQQDARTVARERLVSLGQVFDGQVEVRSGLQAGRVIVVRGNEALRDGQSVEVR